MGGLGSGNHYRTHGDSLEHHRRLDINKVSKAGALLKGWEGRWTWTSSDGEENYINLVGGIEQVELIYRFRKGDEDWISMRETVPIHYVTCHYGGKRALFGCPKCGRRVRFLYGAGPRFLCRHCYDLVHASSREGVFDRKLRKVHKIRRRLGADLALESYLPRPKGMHQATYEKLVNEAEAIEEELTREVANRLRLFSSSYQQSQKGSFWS